MTPIFSHDELRVFGSDLWEKFRSGVRSPEGIIYSGVTLVGVAWASFGIPAINNSEISPETLGIYVIGFLIAVLLDAAMALWKYKGTSSKTELAILVVIILTAFVLTVISSILATRPVDTTATPHQRSGWRDFASPGLWLILVLTIAMSLVVSGIDSSHLAIGSLDKPVEDVKNRG